MRCPKSDLSLLTKRAQSAIADQRSDRPRKTLNWDTQAAAGLLITRVCNTPKIRPRWHRGGGCDHRKTVGVPPACRGPMVAPLSTGQTWAAMPELGATTIRRGATPDARTDGRRSHTPCIEAPRDKTPRTACELPPRFLDIESEVREWEAFCLWICSLSMIVCFGEQAVGMLRGDLAIVDAKSWVCSAQAVRHWQEQYRAIGRMGFLPWEVKADQIRL